MNKPGNAVAVTILDKEYLVACPPEAQSGLREAASALDTKMREIRNTGKVHGLERIAVMAALNLSYETMQASTRDSAIEQSLEQMHRRLDEVLGK
ncbi:cell division protein ZapA [Allohahella marinimesophila]|uniref:Cell division protein ZapA n=1 Tax=Allohahella marinimesophila TaxID=1054972 RepID=A0ABP7PL74_9GAMM